MPHDAGPVARPTGRGVSRLEDLLKRSTNEQLNYIKYLGGILGMVGGLVIWQPVPALILFAATGVILFGLDELIYRLRRDTV